MLKALLSHVLLLAPVAVQGVSDPVHENPVERHHEEFTLPPWTPTKPPAHHHHEHEVPTCECDIFANNLDSTSHGTYACQRWGEKQAHQGDGMFMVCEAPDSNPNGVQTLAEKNAGFHGHCTGGSSICKVNWVEPDWMKRDGAAGECGCTHYRNGAFDVKHMDHLCVTHVEQEHGAHMDVCTPAHPDYDTSRGEGFQNWGCPAPAKPCHTCDVIEDITAAFFASEAASCEGLKAVGGHLVVPEGVKYIPAHQYDSCDHLKTLSLPKCLQEIQDSAFDGTQHLHGDIVIPDTVTSIGKYAFAQELWVTELSAVGPDGVAYPVGAQAPSDSTDTLFPWPQLQPGERMVTLENSDHMPRGPHTHDPQIVQELNGIIQRLTRYHNPAGGTNIGAEIQDSPQVGGARLDDFHHFSLNFLRRMPYTYPAFVGNLVSETWNLIHPHESTPYHCGQCMERAGRSYEEHRKAQHSSAADHSHDTYEDDECSCRRFDYYDPNFLDILLETNEDTRRRKLHMSYEFECVCSPPWSLPKRKDVVIGDGVTYIGEGAFSNMHCNGGDIKIGSSVEYIGVAAFQMTTVHSGFTIPDSTTFVDEYAFAMVGGGLVDPKFGLMRTDPAYDNDGTNWYHKGDHQGLTWGNGIQAEYQFPTGLLTGNLYTSFPKRRRAEQREPHRRRATTVEIAYERTPHAPYLTGGLHLGKGLVGIAPLAFHLSSFTGHLTIPASLEVLGESAFDTVAYMTGLTFAPGSALKHVGDWAFWSFGWHNQWECNCRFDAYELRWRCPLMPVCMDLPPGAAQDSYGTLLNQLVLPAGLESIGNAAFEDAPFSGHLVIPPHVHTIGWRAFAFSNHLSSIDIQGPVKYLEDFTFIGNTRARTVVLPKTVLEIANGTFSSMYSMLAVNIPHATTHIGTGAFSYAFSLVSINGFHECWSQLGDGIAPHVLELGSDPNGPRGYEFYGGDICFPNDMTVYQIRELFDLWHDRRRLSPGKTAEPKPAGRRGLHLLNTPTPDYRDEFWGGGCTFSKKLKHIGDFAFALALHMPGPCEFEGDTRYKDSAFAMCGFLPASSDLANELLHIYETTVEGDHAHDHSSIYFDNSDNMPHYADGIKEAPGKLVDLPVKVWPWYNYGVQAEGATTRDYCLI